MNAKVGGVATCVKWKNKMIRHAELVSASVQMSILVIISVIRRKLTKSDI